MLKTSIAAGLAGSLLLASAAFAQTPTATDKMDKADKADTAASSTSMPSSFQGNWRASKIAGLNVYNDNNENVGSINDLLMTAAFTLPLLSISRSLIEPTF